MALLSVSALGSCQTGGNSKLNGTYQRTERQLEVFVQMVLVFHRNETRHSGRRRGERKNRTPAVEGNCRRFDPAPLKEWMYPCPAGGGRVLCGFRQAGA